MPKARILIAEDEVITSMDLWHILQLWGYEMCEQVTSGEEAVVRAGADRPDVVLIDINLRGGISGIEAAAQITSRFGIPIIFMTGYSDSATMEKASRVKPLGYFIKPIDFYRLKTTIDAAVEGRGEQSP